VAEASKGLEEAGIAKLEAELAALAH